MPTFRGVSVHITDADGNALKEYGTRSLERAVTISSYIQSESDMQFKVQAQPEIPFPASNNRRGKQVVARHAGRKEGRRRVDNGKNGIRFRGDDRREERNFENKAYRPSYPEDSRARHGDLERIRRDRAGRYNDYLGDESPQERSQPRTRDYEAQPDWHLLVSVYLDGRKKPERCGILYTDENHPNFNRGGVLTLAHRWVQNQYGDITSHTWIFKEVGIETMLDKLLINGDIATEGTICKQDEEDLLEAMNATGIDDKEENKMVGQISVVLQRVTLGELRDDWHFEAMHSSGDGDGAELGNSTAGLSHTTGLGKTVYNRDRSHPVRVINYRELDGDQRPYAIFKFYYRNQDVLRKFNFKDFASVESSGSAMTPARRHMNAKLSSLTPLSITQPPSSFTRQRSPTLKGEGSSSRKAGTAKDGSVKGITVDACKWKDDKFKYTDMRSGHGKDCDEDDSDREMDCPASEAGQSETTPGIRLSPPSFRALSKSPLRDLSEAPLARSRARPSAERDRGNLKPQFSNFRVDNASAEEDADDEADSCPPSFVGYKHAPSRVVGARKDSIKQDSTDSDYEGPQGKSGVAKDEDDHGLGEGLAKITLKRKLCGTSSSQGEIAHTSSMSEEATDGKTGDEAIMTPPVRVGSEQMRKRIKADIDDEDTHGPGSIPDSGVGNGLEVAGLMMAQQSDV